MRNKLLVGSLMVMAALGSLVAAFGQGQAPLSRVAGRFVAANYITRNAVIGGPYAAGTVAISVGAVPALPDGRTIQPYTTHTPVRIGQGANVETLTPSVVAGCPAACVLTLATSSTHGSGDLITSGTAGLQEALDDANAAGGGIVTLDREWYRSGGTATIIRAALGYSNVSTIEDTSGSGQAYWTLQPTTLTAVATPTTRSAAAGATQVIDSATAGSFTNAGHWFAVTYVDLMGNESVGSGSFTYTPAGSLAVFWNAPAAATGAVGWIPYAGLTGTSTMYRIVPTASICTLTTIETVVPACAVTNTAYGQTGSNATTLAPVTTSSLTPGYTVATYRLHPQSATTWAYQPSAVPGQGFRTDFGPFTATSGGTTTQVQVLGTVPLPAAYLNSINKSVVVTGRITGTFGTSETPSVRVSLGPIFTTGTPTNVCAMSHTTALSAAVYNAHFSCTMTTNATGATGTIMPNGLLVVQIGAGTTIGNLAVDTGTAAITNNTLAQDQLYVTYVGTSGTSTAVQLLDLHIRTLN